MNAEQRTKLDATMQKARKEIDAVLDRVLVEAYPEAESGDVSPHVVYAVTTAVNNLIEEWVKNNIPAYWDFYPAVFNIEDADMEGKNRVKGYTRGERWNGWATPFFEKDDIIAWLDNTGNDYEFDGGWDVLSVYVGDDRDDPEQYEGIDIEVEGETKHVYAVGAWCWVWTEVQS